MTFIAACVQLNCSSDENANWQSARELITRAAARGATFVATPENTNFLGPHREKVRLAETLEGRTCERFAGLARDLGIYLLLGSFNEKSDEDERCHNTSVLFSPDGECLASYRKIHLFDVDVSDAVRFTESKTIKPGERLVTVETPIACFGLTICYDLRFAEIYQHLADRGANVLLVPSAFTLMTGKDHWEALLRARAIEQQAWVVAPAQAGQHDDRGLRHSYGHSMIVDPWGNVVARIADGTGLALAEIDLDHVRRVREAMPVASHRRLWPVAETVK